jgi:hypothetical protein
LLARYLESVEPINAIMTSANPKANPHQNFSSLFRSANSLARYVMARILEFIRLQNAFDSETLVLLGAAYEKALRRARARGQPEIVREVIAKRIIEMATKGERDPERLCNGALKGIQKSVPRSEKPY